MLDEKQTQEETELWNEANNPPEKTYDLFGQLVDLQIFKGAYQTGTRGAVPFDPAVHQKAQTIIRFYIQPLPEINVKYVDQLTYESPVWADWGKITFPSIKAQGINDAREVTNRWFRFSRVSNGKTYTKSDGGTGEEKTWKIIELYADENACRDAYVKSGGSAANSNGHNAPKSIETDPGKQTAYKFLKVIVFNAVRGLTDCSVAKEAVAKVIAQYPDAVGKYYTADSVETGELMTQANDKLLPF